MIQKEQKYFVVDLGGRPATISFDRLKPTIIDADQQVLMPEDGSPPKTRTRKADINFSDHISSKGQKMGMFVLMSHDASSSSWNGTLIGQWFFPLYFYSTLNKEEVFHPFTDPAITELILPEQVTNSTNRLKECTKEKSLRLYQSGKWDGPSPWCPPFRWSMGKPSQIGQAGANGHIS